MHTLRTISVTKLFGRYDYTLPDASELLDDVNILYGVNGSGKTTLLKLVFHLLSHLDTAGHQTRIAETPFLSLDVTLQDGSKISARKDAQLLVGPVEFKIARPHSKAVTWRYAPGGTQGSLKAEDLPSNIDVDKLPTELRQQVTRALEQKRFFDELRRFELNVFMLTSDRILLGDSVRDVLRSDARAEPLGPRGRTRLADLVIEHRIASVTDALNAASSWVRSKFLDRTYGSSESSSTLYLDVAKRIAKSTYRTKTGLSAAQQAKTIAALEQSIRDIQRRAAEYQEFGLGPLALPPELLPTIQGTKGNRLHLIQTILEPHLASVKARYDSIEPVYHIVSTFVAALNDFLKDKKVAYSVRTGFRIVSDGSEGPPTEISPSQLSSGEQQLLLLFCHILTTRDSPSIFFIDEPELSLNIVWQRRLVSSMLEVAKGSSLQLLLASHSMEILAKHRNRVVGMRETKVG